MFFGVFDFGFVVDVFDVFGVCCVQFVLFFGGEEFEVVDLIVDDVFGIDVQDVVFDVIDVGYVVGEVGCY